MNERVEWYRELLKGRLLFWFVLFSFQNPQHEFSDWVMVSAKKRGLWNEWMRRMEKKINEGNRWEKVERTENSSQLSLAHTEAIKE